jgi:hypothetical protein
VTNAGQLGKITQPEISTPEKFKISKIKTPFLM